MVGPRRRKIGFKYLAVNALHSLLVKSCHDVNSCHSEKQMSQRPSAVTVTYMRQGTGSALVQVMACSASSHYPNQCWGIVSCTLRNKLQWNSNHNTKPFVHEHTFKIPSAKWFLFCAGRDEFKYRPQNGSLLSDSQRVNPVFSHRSQLWGTQGGDAYHNTWPQGIYLVTTVLFIVNVNKVFHPIWWYHPFYVNNMLLKVTVN